MSPFGWGGWLLEGRSKGSRTVGVLWRSRHGKEPQRLSAEVPEMRAGQPHAFAPSGMSLLTNDIVPMTALSPIDTPIWITELGPM